MQQIADLSGRNFIVTGAARGIGLAIAERFVHLGARVSGWDMNIGAMTGNLVFADTRQVDVTSEAQIKQALDGVLSTFGEIDGIIANAGINGPTKPLTDYSLEEWNQVLSVDLTGVFLSVKAVLPHLQKRGYGRIVIIASVAAKEGNPGAVPYGAAKAGVVGFAKGLARELLPSDITVNCVAPALTQTDLLDDMSDDYLADRRARIPMGRLCTPSEVAAMAAFAASPDCSFTTGQIFDVTGGRATW